MPDRWKLFHIVGASVCIGGFSIFFSSLFLSMVFPTNTSYLRFMFVGLLPMAVGGFMLDYLEHRPLYLNCKVYYCGIQKDEFPVGPFKGQKAANDWKIAVYKQKDIEAKHPANPTLDVISIDFMEIPDCEFTYPTPIQVFPGYLTNAFSMVKHLIDQEYYLR